jgi:deoxyribose-phosphate aldolase
MHDCYRDIHLTQPLRLNRKNGNTPITSKNGFSRLAYIIKRPPSIQLTIKVAEIEAAIEDMRKEMDILDGIKLNKVGQRLENVAESVHDIEKSVHGRWACAIVDVIVLKTVSIAST